MKSPIFEEFRVRCGPEAAKGLAVSNGKSLLAENGKYDDSDSDGEDSDGGESKEGAKKVSISK